jgi:hypothetical protein
MTRFGRTVGGTSNAGEDEPLYAAPPRDLRILEETRGLDCMKLEARLRRRPY